MDPFVLSRNAFNIYCSEYVNSVTTVPTNNNNNNQSLIDINSSGKENRSILYHDRAVRMLNQRYEYFLQTLDQLQKQTHISHNTNSISNSEKDGSILSSVTSRRKKRKYLQKLNKRRMPKINITVSCTEHRTQQQPNIKMN